MIGRTLNHYRIREKLGQGGMGEVYLAEDTRLRREVALKVLPANLAADPGRRSRLEREAQAVAALSHPNIVTIFSVEDADELVFITMERVQGRSLTDLLETEGMDLQEVFEIFIPLADAVAAAHERGITHRDLKPDNVMVDDDGRVKVLDFGLAKVADPAQEQVSDSASHLPTATVTAEGQILGTASYMSPEQAEGKTVDARSDVFSLGIVLYEMSTGKRPFSGDTPISTISSILKDTPASVTDLRAELPRHLDRILRRCLHKDPDRRYQSAKELRNELQELRSEIGPEEPTIESASRQPESGRPAWLWPAVAIAGVVVAMVVGFSQLGSRQTPREEPLVAASPEAAPAEERRMIVVIPFENLGEADDDYFAAGVTEEITARLGTVADLGVISGNSAMLYAGTTKSTQQIGEELGVDYLLQGKVRWARSAEGPSRVRITPQLIRVADDIQVWADSFDETVDDVFSVQTRIATAVIEQLGGALGDSGHLLLAKPTTNNLEAWQAYLRGRQFNDLRLGNENPLAEQMLERAVELDPEFVDAWAELSKTHSVSMHMGLDISAERDAKALEAAETALRLDPTSPEAHLAMGYYHYWGHKDYDAAMVEFNVAQKLLPNSFEVLSARGFVRRRKGDWEGALQDLTRANEVNPLDYRSFYEIGLTRFALRDFDGAREMFQRTLNIQPDFTEAMFWTVNSYWVESGDLVASRAAIDAIPKALSENWVSLTRFLQPLYERDPAAARQALGLFAGERFNLMPLILPRGLLSGWTRRLEGDEEGARGDFEQAARFLEARLEKDPDDYTSMPALGLVYVFGGRVEEGLELGHRAAEIYGMDRDRFFGLNLERYVAWIEAEAGEPEAAIDRLERLLSVPNMYLSPSILRLSPMWDSLRDNPRFASLLEP